MEARAGAVVDSLGRAFLSGLVWVLQSHADLELLVGGNGSKPAHDCQPGDDIRRQDVPAWGPGCRLRWDVELRSWGARSGSRRSRQAGSGFDG